MQSLDPAWFIKNPPKVRIPGVEGFTLHLGSKLHDTVVFIGYANPGSASGFTCEGTGFLLSYHGGDYLITARHIAQKLGKDPFVLRVNQRGKATLLQADMVQWHFHSDPLVDLATVPLLLSQSHGFACKYLPEKTLLPKEDFAKLEIDVGDFTYVLGLFQYLHGNEINMPMVHMGNVCLLPPAGEKIPVGNKLTGKTEHVEAYLIESRAIDGASGSPVIVRPSFNLGGLTSQEGAEPDGTRAIIASTKIYLLGLFHGAWFLPPDDIVRQTAQAPAGAVVPVGIGVVVPSYKIIELLEIDSLKNLRKRKPPVVAQMTSVSEAAAPASDANPKHLEDFNRLLSAAAKTPQQDD